MFNIIRHRLAHLEAENQTQNNSKLNTESLCPKKKKTQQILYRFDAPNKDNEHETQIVKSPESLRNRCNSHIHPINIYIRNKKHRREHVYYSRFTTVTN